MIAPREGAWFRLNLAGTESDGVRTLVPKLGHANSNVPETETGERSRSCSPTPGNALRYRTFDRKGNATSHREIVERSRGEFEVFDGAWKGWTEAERRIGWA